MKSIYLFVVLLGCSPMPRETLQEKHDKPHHCNPNATADGMMVCEVGARLEAKLNQLIELEKRQVELLEKLMLK